MVVRTKSSPKDTTRLAAPHNSAVGDEAATDNPPLARERKMKTATAGDPVNKVAARTLVPSAPESEGAPGVKRKRLAKAFSRPLDKKIRKETFVRDCFTFPQAEYAQLVMLKKRLGEQGIAVKKGELMRAALMLLLELGENELKSRLAKL